MNGQGSFFNSTSAGFSVGGWACFVHGGGGGGAVRVVRSRRGGRSHACTHMHAYTQIHVHTDTHSHFWETPGRNGSRAQGKEDGWSVRGSQRTGIALSEDPGGWRIRTEQTCGRLRKAGRGVQAGSAGHTSGQGNWGALSAPTIRQTRDEVQALGDKGAVPLGELYGWHALRKDGVTGLRFLRCISQM